MEWLGDYRLRIRFANGVTGEVDFAGDVSRFPGILKRLQDRDFFSRAFAHPEAGCLSWPDEIDLDPDVLYTRITGAPLPGQHVV